MTVREITAVASALAGAIARLHQRGIAHGAVGIDDVLVRRNGDGSLEVALAPPAGRGTPEDDVGALGALIGTCLALSRARSDGDGDGDADHARALADIAADARRGGLAGDRSAHDVLAALRQLRTEPPIRSIRAEVGQTAWRARLALLAWFVLLVSTVVWLPRLAPHVSPPPAFDGATAVSAWLDQRDAPTALAGVLRVAVHGVAIYLLVSTVAACAFQLLPSNAAHRLPLLDRLTAAPVRRVVHAAFGVSLAFGALTSIAATTSEEDAGPSVSIPLPAPVPPSTTTTTTSTRTSLATPVVMPEPDTEPTPSPPATWTVRPGDSFWNIAERLVSGAIGRPATDAEVDGYWRRLIETNRSRLADPENPDLLFDLQELGVPPLPAPPPPHGA